MPVLSSPIGFLYFLALISSEPVAIGGPPATCRRPPLTTVNHQNGLQNGFQNGLQNGFQNGLQNGLQNGPKTGPKAVNFGIHLWIAFL